ncbi:MAG TPA: GGDEF domain-containing protein [Geminicoccaceae bacterium]|jgi:diguanylate cyclase (GGDEF)-like protein|nr:GGDEF domain-containing protein [Geminicoccaceae bacterium]
MMADRGRDVAVPVPRVQRMDAGEPLGRLMAALFGLVERLGWQRATLLCTLTFTIAAAVMTVALKSLLGVPPVALSLDLLVVAAVTVLLAGPGLAVALRLVEHLGRARARLLVEIDRRMVAEQQLRRLATTDDLTGLSNRRHFVERAREAMAIAQRYDQWVTFAVVDVDRFKHLNDRFGHAAGDRALVVLAAVLRANLRATDLAARFGGDEFVLLMPLTDPKAGRVAAERIRRAVREDCGRPPFRVSVGIASAKGPVAALEALMARADQALYDAKRTGRNRIGICAGPTVGPDDATMDGLDRIALPLKG